VNESAKVYNPLEFTYHHQNMKIISSVADIPINMGLDRRKMLLVCGRCSTGHKDKTLGCHLALECGTQWVVRVFSGNLPVSQPAMGN
jgi:hypothetical protein